MIDSIPTTIPRTALITGGSQRLGQAIALELARSGFDIAIHCRASILAAEETRSRIQALGRRSIVLRADLASEDATRRLLPEATRQLGPVGVLVNNASRFDRDEWHDVTRASWDAHLEPNLRAPFVLIQEFARMIPATAEGVIINMLDQRVLVAHPAFRFLHDFESRPLGPHSDHGACTGSACQGECDRSRTRLAQCATDRGAIRAPVKFGSSRPWSQPRGGSARRPFNSTSARHDRADDCSRWRATHAMGSRSLSAGAGRMNPAMIASIDAMVRHVFLRDMILSASIGIHPHEQRALQRIRINVDLGVDDDAAMAGLLVGPDELARVVDYEKVAARVRSVVGAGHVRLVETLAERIAQTCLQDLRVRTARIRVEKLDIFSDSLSAGVEIERSRRNSSTRPGDAAGAR